MPQLKPIATFGNEQEIRKAMKLAYGSTKDLVVAGLKGYTNDDDDHITNKKGFPYLLMDYGWSSTRDFNLVLIFLGMYNYAVSKARKRNMDEYVQALTNHVKLPKNIFNSLIYIKKGKKYAVDTKNLTATSGDTSLKISKDDNLTVDKTQLSTLESTYKGIIKTVVECIFEGTFGSKEGMKDREAKRLDKLRSNEPKIKSRIIKEVAKRLSRVTNWIINGPYVAGAFVFVAKKWGINIKHDSLEVVEDAVDATKTEDSVSGGAGERAGVNPQPTPPVVTTEPAEVNPESTLPIGTVIPTPSAPPPPPPKPPIILPVNDKNFSFNLNIAADSYDALKRYTGETPADATKKLSDQLGTEKEFHISITTTLNLKTNPDKNAEAFVRGSGAGGVKTSEIFVNLDKLTPENFYTEFRKFLDDNKLLKKQTAKKPIPGAAPPDRNATENPGTGKTDFLAALKAKQKEKRPSEARITITLNLDGGRSVTVNLKEAPSGFKLPEDDVKSLFESKTELKNMIIDFRTTLNPNEIDYTTGGEAFDYGTTDAGARFNDGNNLNVFLKSGSNDNNNTLQKNLSDMLKYLQENDDQSLQEKQQKEEEVKAKKQSGAAAPPATKGWDSSAAKANEEKYTKVREAACELKYWEPRIKGPRFNGNLKIAGSNWPSMKEAIVDPAYEYYTANATTYQSYSPKLRENLATRDKMANLLLDEKLKDHKDDIEKAWNEVKVKAPNAPTSKDYMHFRNYVALLYKLAGGEPSI